MRRAYDPDTHGELDAEPGDQVWVLTKSGRAARKLAIENVAEEKTPKEPK